MGFTTEDLTDARIEEFIGDQQAFVEQRIGHEFTSESDDGYDLARSVVTDLAAMTALVRMSGGTTSGLDYSIGKLDVEKAGQFENRLRVIFELKVRAREGLSVLEQMHDDGFEILKING